MGEIGVGLIAMGLGCLFFAFLGWWGNRGSFQDEAEPGSVAERRQEWSPVGAETYTKLYARAARPLTWLGLVALIMGTGLVLVSAVR